MGSGSIEDVAPPARTVAATLQRQDGRRREAAPLDGQRDVIPALGKRGGPGFFSARRDGDAHARGTGARDPQLALTAGDVPPEGSRARTAPGPAPLVGREHPAGNRFSSTAGPHGRRLAFDGHAQGVGTRRAAARACRQHRRQQPSHEARRTRHLLDYRELYPVDGLE